MKKNLYRIISIALIIIISIAFIACLSGCTGFNKQIIDLQYSFNYGIIELPNGEIIEGRVQTWTDFEDGDQIQVRINDVVYLVHSTDIVLMNKPMSDIIKMEENINDR